eukprot:scaffold33858_cov70-Phaeocystis_antarctica.AAC.7
MVFHFPPAPRPPLPFSFLGCTACKKFSRPSAQETGDNTSGHGVMCENQSREHRAALKTLKYGI